MSVSMELTINDLLFIEDDPSILEFRCPITDILLWPHLRISIFRFILTDILYPSQSSEDGSPEPRFIRKVGTLSRSWLHNLSHFRRSARSDICFVTAGIANQFVEGEWFNRLTGYLAEVSPLNTLTLEDHFEWRWSFPRSNKRVVFLAPYRAYHTVLTRLRVRDEHRRLAQSLVRYVGERAIQQIGWALSQSRTTALEIDLARKIASLPLQYDAYRRMFEKISPKILLLGSAGYGGVYGTMIAAARSLDIKTAEYQHGAVSKGHDGYNFSQTMCASPAFRRVFPDYFLSYGTWWNSQVSIPAKAFVVGNPYRDVQIAKQPHCNPKRQLLIFSDGMEFSIFINLAKSIEETARERGLSVVIRPHPLERSGVQARYGNAIGSIGLDYEPNVFKSLLNAKILVSELSTGLFDAIGLADHIYMWNTHKSRFSFPEHPFVSFSTVEELKQLVAEPTKLNDLSPEKFWAPDWKANYQNFLEVCGVREA